MIRHIWMTVTDRTEQDFFVLSDLVLRMYWDGEQNRPWMPAGGFFLLRIRDGYQDFFPAHCSESGEGILLLFSHGIPIESRFTLENHMQPLSQVFYQIDYTIQEELSEDLAYFHAQYRRERLPQKKRDYVVCG